MSIMWFSLSMVGMVVCGATLARGEPVDVGSTQSLGNQAPGSFASPAMTVKPKFRFWLPDASIAADLLADDILQLANRGAGGTELLPYFKFPATDVTPSDWDLYGYGTKGYAAIVKAALKAHQAAGMVFDFAGSSNGCVPAEKGNPGLSWELFPYNITINGSYHGTIPGWGKGELISVVTYAVMSRTIAGPDFHGPFGWGKTYPEYTISNASLTDVRSLVQANGAIAVNVTSVPDAQYYELQAFYLRQPLSRENSPWSSTPKTIFANGTIAADHFSVAGAKLITDFLEQHVLDDETRALFGEVGNYLWEDSVEIDGYLYWTPGLEDEFFQTYDYDIRRYAPLLQSKNGYQTKSWPSSYRLDTSDRGDGIVADFRGLLTTLSKSYTDHITKWAHEVLGMKFSSQPGYNMPLDMLQMIPNIEVPEAETLSFGNSIDGFLQFAGPADLSGKTVLSVELGADRYRAYSQSWSSLLYDAKHAFAGGLNQVVIHGAVYSHNFTNTTWPSYTSHDYEYAAPHSRHQPAWDVGYVQALGYLARVQWVLQTGVPKVDLLFWDKQTAQNAFPSSLYAPDDLTRSGYSYEYLSPSNFVLREAYVKDGIFAPTRQEAKLLVLRNNDTITPKGVEYLTEYAAAGLPVLFYGDLPSRWASSNTSAISTSKTMLEGLLKLDNVHQVPNQTLATKIASIGIQPRAQVNSNGTWWTRWREVSNGDTYIFIYNDGASSTGNVTFAITGTPYLLNAWSGEEEVIAQYLTTKNSTTIPFTLSSLETVIVRFSKGSMLSTHVLSSSEAVLGFHVAHNGAKIYAKTAASNSSAVMLSSGKKVSLEAGGIQAAYSLTNWTLTLEHWLPQDDLYDLDLDAKKVNYTLPVNGPLLSSWQNLGFQNLSGIGYYITTFQWQPASTLSNPGAQLTIPPVSHGLVGTLNGMALPTLDITNPVVDISSYLVHGTNTLVLTVSSTLMNTLSLYWGNLRTVGKGPSEDYAFYTRRGLGVQQNGIIGEVRIVPYVLAQVL